MMCPRWPLINQTQHVSAIGGLSGGATAERRGKVKKAICSGGARRAKKRKRIAGAGTEFATGVQRAKEVREMALQVTWDSKVCIHSGNCVKTLPQVFRVENGKFVIEPSAADDEKVRATVAACPSKALKINQSA